MMRSRLLVCLTLAVSLLWAPDAVVARSPAKPPKGGSGDVAGPASATNEGLVVFDGATGKAVKQLPAGPAGHVLTQDGDGSVSMQPPPAGGDVDGPAGATADSLPLFDGATGKLLKQITGGETGDVPTRQSSGAIAFESPLRAKHVVAALGSFNLHTAGVLDTSTGQLRNLVADTSYELPPLGVVVGCVEGFACAAGETAIVQTRGLITSIDTTGMVPSGYDGYPVCITPGAGAITWLNCAHHQSRIVGFVVVRHASLGALLVSPQRPGTKVVSIPSGTCEASLWSFRRGDVCIEEAGSPGNRVKYCEADECFGSGWVEPIATSGDSATAFFTSGQIEAARGGTGLDTSAATGVPRVIGGTWSVASTLESARGGLGINASALTGVVRFTTGVASADAGLSHLASSTSNALRGVLSDELGTGPALFGLHASMADDIACAAGEVVIRDASDAAFDCVPIHLTGTANPNAGPTDCLFVGQWYTDTDGDVTVKPSGQITYRCTDTSANSWTATNTNFSKDIDTSDFTPNNVAEVNVRSGSWLDEILEGIDVAVRRQVVGPVSGNYSATLTADASCMRRPGTFVDCLNRPAAPDGSANANRHDTAIPLYAPVGGPLKLAATICEVSQVAATGFDAGDHWIWCPYELDHPSDGTDIALATGNDCITIALASDCTDIATPYAACAGNGNCPTCIGPSSDGLPVVKALSSPVALSDNPSSIVMALEATTDTGTVGGWQMACSFLVE
jgi:hypothetical protein